MKSAMKAGEKDRLRTVRLILADIQRSEVDRRQELDDNAVLAVIEKAIKQRRDSIKLFLQGGRKDLSAIEEVELEIIQTYLPEQLSEDELATLVDAVIEATGAANIRDMGKVMGAIKAKAAGKADMGTVGAMVKARLA